MSSVTQILTSKGVSYNFHQYNHDVGCKNFSIEASTKLGINIERIFKTLIVQGGDNFYCCILPGNYELDLKNLAKIIGDKKVILPNEETVIKVTGYNFGGVSPLGQRKKITTFLDINSNNFETIFVSAGTQGEEIELAPKILQKITNATISNLKRT